MNAKKYKYFKRFILFSQYCLFMAMPMKKSVLLMEKKNFEAIPSADKQFIEVNGAGHLNVWGVGGEVYFNQVAGFIGRQGK